MITIYLPPAFEGWREVMFSQVCVCSAFGKRGYLHQVLGGGYPILPDRGGEVTPFFLMRSYPIQFWWGVPPFFLMSGWVGGGYPRMGYSPIRTRWGYPCLHLDWMGVHPPLPRSGDRAAMRRAVCLLRSHRRTFLFLQVIVLDCWHLLESVHFIEYLTPKVTGDRN